jgi:hypothetical protein
MTRLTTVNVAATAALFFQNRNATAAAEAAAESVVLGFAVGGIVTVGPFLTAGFTDEITGVAVTVGKPVVDEIEALVVVVKLWVITWESAEEVGNVAGVVDGVGVDWT